MGSAASAAVRPDGDSSPKPKGPKSSGGILQKFRSRRKGKQRDSDSSSDDSDDDDDDDDDEVEEQESAVKSGKKKAKKQRSREIAQALADPALVGANWEEHMCDIHHCLYYFNTVTGESTWDQPACFGAKVMASPPKSSSSRLISSPPPSAPPPSSRKKSAKKVVVELHQPATDSATDADDKAAEYVFTLIPWAYQEPILSTAVEAVGKLPKGKLNNRDKDGNTLLALAAQHQNKAIVKALIGLKADVNIMNHGGSTALAQVCATKDDTNREIATMLIHAGALNTIDNDGCTPLHWAASCGDQVVCTNLLRFAKADPTLTDSYGFTPVQYAAEAGHEKLANELQTFGRATKGPQPETYSNNNNSNSSSSSSSSSSNGDSKVVPSEHDPNDLAEASIEEQVAWVAKESASLSARSQQDTSDGEDSGISGPGASVGPETSISPGSQDSDAVQSLRDQLLAKERRIAESEQRLKTALSLCNKLLSVNRGLMPKSNGVPSAKLPPLLGSGSQSKKSRPVVQKLQFDKVKKSPSKNAAIAMGLPAL